MVAVASGDALVVDDGSGTERKIFLSSLRAPRAGPGPAEQPWGREAKENMRKKLIGKRVQVIVEYVRSAGDFASGAASAAGSGRAGEDRVFATIMQGKANVAVELVAAGLAEVTKHRMDEERSAQYEELLEAETKAKEAKKCMHSGKPPAPYSVVDLSLRPRAPAGATAAEAEAVAQQARLIAGKCKQYLPMFQREKQSRATVEHVFGGARLKLFVPKENCVLAFALTGVKCPRAAGVGASAEPFGDEALRFTRALCMQHDVTFEVEGADKGDNFLGAVLIGSNSAGKQQNLAVELLAAGLAELVAFSAERSPHAEALFAAEAAAKAARVGMWKNWVAPVEKTPEERLAEEEAARAAGAAAEISGQHVRLQVTDASSSTHFSAQIVGDESLALVVDQMADFTENTQAPIKPFAPKKGQVCAAEFADGSWYRARVDGRTEAGHTVTFIDFGNQETDVAADRLRALDGVYAQLASIPPCALNCRLSALRAPGPASEFGRDACAALQALTADREILARVDVTRDANGCMHVCAWDAAYASSGNLEVHGQGSVNEALALDGWARVEKRPDSRTPAALVARLREAEASAKKMRVCNVLHFFLLVVSLFCSLTC